MTSPRPNRVSAGVSTGGRFAPKSSGEAEPAELVEQPELAERTEAAEVPSAEASPPQSNDHLFVDERPAWCRPGWVGGINYPLRLADTGECVMGTYSAGASRHIVPGEQVRLCDEFGYWRTEPQVTFLGRLDSGNYAYLNPDGHRRQLDYHVVRDVIPAGPPVPPQAPSQPPSLSPAPPGARSGGSRNPPTGAALEP